MNYKCIAFLFSWAFVFNIEAASTNYRAKHKNDDGSFTIVGPKFRTDGVNHCISTHSNLDGVCILFGLSTYDEDGLSYSGNLKANTVVIGNDGKFSHYYRPSPYNGRNAKIDSIRCN